MAMSDKTPLRILLVEDDRSDVELIQEQLRGFKIHWQVVDTAEKGLALLPGDVDLILFNLKLPLMSGIDFVRELRNRQLDTTIPHAIVSGTPDLVTKALVELGNIHLYWKPFTEDQFRGLCADFYLAQ